MAFFKFRKAGDEPSAAPPKAESVELMRKRAKHRLLGATVLVLIGVFGFPLLFDKQQRPISVDTPIEIPDRNKAKPLSIPATAAVDANKAEVAAQPAASAPVVAAAAAPMIEEKAVEPPAPSPASDSKKAAPAQPKAADKPVAKVASAAASADDGKKAQALLDATAPEKKTDAGDGRFVVQVGAFSDVTRAREARMKLEHAGLKTYTQVVETKDGRRIRVRVGPFANKAEADKAAAKIKGLELPAAILTL
jgi:DedD protein